MEPQGNTLTRVALLKVLASLQRVNAALVTPTTALDSLLQLIVEEATALLEGAGGILYLHNTTPNMIVAAAACGTAARLKGETTSLEDSLGGWVARHNQPVFCPVEDPRVNQLLARQIQVHTVAAVPLASEEQGGKRVIGTLEVLDKQGEMAAFDPAALTALEPLQMLATQATLAINKKRQDDRLHRHTEQLRVINELFRDSESAHDLQAHLRKAASQISKAFGYRSDIGIRTHDSLVFTTVYANGQFLDQPIDLSVSRGITGRVATSGQPQIVPDVTQHPDYFPASPDTQSELAVPLIDAKGNIIGVLNAESTQLGAFSPADRDTVQAFEAMAAGITRVIENACRYTELTALHQLTTVINAAENVDQLLDHLVDTVATLFGVGASALYLWDRNAQRLRLARQKGLPDAVTARVGSLEKGQGLAGRVFESGAPIVIETVTSDPRFDGLIPMDASLHSGVAVPIKTAKCRLGVLSIWTNTKRLFPRYEVDLLATIGTSSGGAIEKARLHQQVVEAEHKYRQLFESARDPIFFLESSGRIIDANAAAAQVSGYSRAELLNMEVAQFVTSDAEGTKARERVARTAQGIEVPTREFTIRHKNNSQLIIESNLTPIVDSRGHSIAVQALWRDITARKQAEAALQRQNQQLQALLDISQEAFQAFEQEDLLSRAALRATQLLASTACHVYRRDAASGRLEEIVVPPHGSPELSEGFKALVEQVGQTGQGRMANSPNTLTNPPRNVLVVPIKSQTTVLGVLSVNRGGDLVEHFYTDEDYQRFENVAHILTLTLEYRRLAAIHHKQQAAQQALEQASLVGAFLGHKLGGFLGSLSLTLRQIARHVQQGAQEEAIELLDTLLENNRTVSRFAEQFRNMAKPLQASRELVPLESVVEEALRQARVPTHIQIRQEELILRPVQASRSLLLEVLEGVIRNAVDAMPHGGTLTIRGVTTTVHNRVESCLQFSDTGQGMPPETQQNLFTPFFTTKHESNGIGLGLWLARLYLQTLGGDIDAASTLHQGSVFTLHLPAVPAPRPLANTTSESAEQTTALYGGMTASRPTDVSVLVVEDDLVWQRLLPRMLRQRGVRVHLVRSHAEAERELFDEEQDFSAFVVDVRLVEHETENLEGLQVVERIRSRYASAPVLILSAWPFQLAEAKARFERHSESYIIADKTRDAEVEAALDEFCRRLVHSPRQSR
jgi:PAS domain S-box-containing protein